MEVYRGIVESVLKRGADAYQVTMGFYPSEGGETKAVSPPASQAAQVFVYRADIAIEGDRTILFPDRGLARCMAAYSDASGNTPAAGLEQEWMVGKIASGLCLSIGKVLLERKGILPQQSASLYSDIHNVRI